LSGGTSANFGFASGTFSGHVQSDGSYSFTAAGNASLAAGGVAFGSASYNLALSSANGLTGTGTGALNPRSFRIASTTFTVSRTNGVTKLSGGGNIDVGFIKTRFGGTIKSNGTYSFTGSTTVSVGLAGVEVGSGTVSMTVSNDDFSGKIRASV